MRQLSFIGTRKQHHISYVQVVSHELALVSTFFQLCTFEQPIK